MGGAGQEGGAANSSNKRFTKPKTAEEVAAAKKEEFCMNVWGEYRNSCCNGSEGKVDDICSLEDVTLNRWMCHFVLEIWKQNGDEYPPNTLHHICSGIMRHVRSHGKPEIDFYKGPVFANFRSTLDAEMK